MTLPPGKPRSTFIVRLETILRPLELDQIFATPQPLEIELGSGDGSFLVAYAKMHPERNFIGVERLLGRIQKMDRKAQRAALANLRGVRIESSYFLEHLLPPGSATALHLYFPDPWPKRRHERHRLVNERFPNLALKVLAPGGMIYLRTDDAPYFRQMTAAFANSPAFEPIETPAELATLRTDFELEFHEKGIATLRAAYRGVPQ